MFGVNRAYETWCHRLLCFHLQKVKDNFTNYASLWRFVDYQLNRDDSVMKTFWD